MKSSPMIRTRVIRANASGNAKNGLETQIISSHPYWEVLLKCNYS